MYTLKYVCTCVSGPPQFKDQEIKGLRLTFQAPRSVLISWGDVLMGLKSQHFQQKKCRDYKAVGTDLGWGGGGKKKLPKPRKSFFLYHTYIKRIQLCT